MYCFKLKKITWKSLEDGGEQFNFFFSFFLSVLKKMEVNGSSIFFGVV
jgi:hypothetical protein